MRLRVTENQAAENRYDIAAQAAQHAKQFGAEGPDFTNEAIQQREETTQQLQCLFTTTARLEAEECLTVGLSVSKTGDFDMDLKNCSGDEIY